MILQYDLDKYRKYSSPVSQKVKQGDTLKLKFNIYENGISKNLTGYSADLRWINADNTFVNIGSTKVTVGENLVTVECDNNCTKAHGTCKFELHLHSSLEEDYSFTQKVDVYESVYQGQAASQNVSTILDDLNEANINAEKFVKDYGNLYGISDKVNELNKTKANNTKVEDLQQQINNLVLNAGGDSNSEVVQARAVFKTLNDRISSCKVNIEEYCRRTLVMGRIDGIDHTLNPSTSVLTNGVILTATNRIDFSIQDGYKYIYFTWKTNGEISENNFASDSGWKTTTETIEKGTYFTVQIAKIDGTPCSLSDINAISLKEVNELNEEIEALKNKPTLYHVIGTGQSLSVGSEGNPALTTLCPLEYVGKAFVFNGGARVIDGENFEIGEQGNLSDKSTMFIMSAHEQDHKLHIDDNKDGIADRDAIVGETISSGLAYQFVKATNQKVLVSQHGFGGLAYKQIKKGTLSYNNMIRAIYNAKQIAERSGMNYEVVGLTLVHGEADSTAGTTESQYISYLEELQSDIDADVKAITGQSRTVKLYTSQTASASSYSLSKSDIPNAIFKASVKNENIVMVCPQYWFTYKSVHMDNKGYRRLGEYFGGIIARDFNKLPKEQIYPIKSVLNGNKAEITFNIPSPSILMFDVQNVMPRSDGHYGFELNGDSNNAQITKVEITGRDIVTITFDKAPSNDSYIGYAFTPLPDEMGKIGMVKGIRGNLRSNYAFDKILDNAELPQWCCIFNIPINYNN